MRIAIAHPDRLTREAVRRSLLSTDLAPAWIATDARELERMLRRDPPDLLLLDVSLSGPGGSMVRAARLASAACLVLTPDEAASGVYEALSAGALGHVAPPRLEADGELGGSARLIARIQRVQSLIGQLHTPQAAPNPRSDGAPRNVPIIALGASTGGPHALAQVLAQLPSGLAAAVLIVQHIDGDFSDGLVEWLSSHCVLPVQLARRGDLIRAGCVYVGGTQGHMVLLASQQISYLAPLKADLHVPSVDMLFRNLAEQAHPGAAALLTGMGSDGAQGLLRLKQAGWHTIAQDEASSVVYGMPRAAIEMGGAVQTLPLAAIGNALTRACRAGVRS